MSVIGRIRRSLQQRGVWGSLQRALIAGVRPLVLAGRQRASRRRARELAAQGGTLRLHLGSGPERLAGWVNVDLYFPAELCLDLRAPLPFPDDSVDAIYSQHFLEHLDHAAGLHLLGECARVLKPGGWMRVSTPDLEGHARAYLAGTLSAEGFNGALRDHDHLYLYDRAELTALFAGAGLVDVRRAEARVSACALLANLETRLPEAGAPADLITEGRKPGGGAAR
jgi:predicted SAM-dependent methyltransferase